MLFRDRPMRPGRRVEQDGSMNPSDAILSARFSGRMRDARLHLLDLMARRGLFPSDGWGIADSLRPHADGWQLVLRPIHMRLTPPEDLECVVEIDHLGQIDASCSGD